VDNGLGWCASEYFSPDLLAPIPEEARNVVCVCRRCVIAANFPEARERHRRCPIGYLLQSDERVRLPEVSFTEPDHAQRLRDETELLSFTVSGHPLEQFPDVVWDTYFPIRDLARYPSERVSVCGLIIADRSHHQVTGDQMKFITICD
jgi:DNA polymerase III alpha subunit